MKDVLKVAGGVVIAVVTAIVGAITWPETVVGALAHLPNTVQGVNEAHAIYCRAPEEARTALRGQFVLSDGRPKFVVNCQ